MAVTILLALVAVVAYTVSSSDDRRGARAPAAPAIRALSSDQPGVVEVRWRPVDGVARYRVNASLEPSMNDPVTRSFTTLSGSLVGLDPGSPYYVTVEALGSGDRPVRAATRRVVVLGPAPSGVSVEAKGLTAAEVRWKKVDGVQEYVVQRAPSQEMTGANAQPVGDVDHLRIDGLEPGSTTWVTVQAGNDARATSAPVKVTLPRTTPISVGSFNLFGVDNDGNLPSGARPWRVRRGVVVDEIMKSNLDVVGLQEANQSKIYGARVDFGPNQMTDLEGSLQREAGGWQLVNDIPYNCARGDSTHGCAARDRGASNGTRIVYRSDRVDVVASGSVRYRAQSAQTARYLAWAIMRPKDGGPEFFFGTTHLQPGKSGTDTSARRRQWQQLTAEVRARAAGRPVIVTGDFNTSRNQNPGEMFAAMQAAGFGDVLGTRARVNPPTGVRAKTVVNGYIGSYNGFKRSLPGSKSCYCSNQRKFGNSIDHIFVSNDLTVPRFQLVAPVGPGYQLVGTIPSDHNLVTAVIELPVGK